MLLLFEIKGSNFSGTKSETSENPLSLLFLRKS